MARTLCARTPSVRTTLLLWLGTFESVACLNIDPTSCAREHCRLNIRATKRCSQGLHKQCCSNSTPHQQNFVPRAIPKPSVGRRRSPFATVSVTKDETRPPRSSQCRSVRVTTTVCQWRCELQACDQSSLCETATDHFALRSVTHIERSKRKSPLTNRRSLTHTPSPSIPSVREPTEDAEALRHIRPAGLQKKQPTTFVVDFGRIWSIRPKSQKMDRCRSHSGSILAVSQYT